MMSENQFLINITSLAKSYKTGGTTLQVIDNLNLSVKSGSMVAIMGPSGSGKSTLLSLMAGFDFPDKGQICYPHIGELWAFGQHQIIEFRRRAVGFIFQRFNLLSDLTAVQNVLLALRLAGLDGTKAETSAYEALRFVGMAGEAERLPSQLSVGQMQRVAIARAIAKAPKIIFADEPTGSVDAENKTMIIDLLRQLQSNGATIVVATHDNEVADSCNQKYRLIGGELIPA
jgi:putative ABC transport system ATP-binding protein